MKTFHNASFSCVPYQAVSMVQEKGPLWSGIDLLDFGKGKCKRRGLEFVVNGTRLFQQYTGGAPRAFWLQHDRAFD